MIQHWSIEAHSQQQNNMAWQNLVHVMSLIQKNFFISQMGLCAKFVLDKLFGWVWERKKGTS